MCRSIISSELMVQNEYCGKYTFEENSIAIFKMKFSKIYTFFYHLHETMNTIRCFEGTAFIGKFITITMLCKSRFEFENEWNNGMHHCF